ncbi:hypothetical protein CBR_g44316 [Chara braunii]|uniref:CCHC-type domain-containing protein n=1 Tax=Chara braunii TaxID=69332 RepID=A0A388K2Z6_CHABU|nr:hypothetical protein CBR_g44316 [Chara braunii]|eukprot:GBG64431.1 hypothetical protein CBR_g44316 [Chara braunii]
MPAVRNCYNCGQPGHISRFCPLPDRRLNGGQPSNAIVPAQPLMNVPAATNVGTAVPYYSGQFNGGGSGSGLGRRVNTLEEIVGKINSKHEADEARERREREEEDKKERERDDEERRLKEKKEREDLQKELHKEMSTKLDKVCEVVNGKKAGDVSEIEQLKAQKQCEVAEANAEVWRNEALRSGNKRGSVAICQTPGSAARVRSRVTPGVSPCPVARVDQQLKAMVERHQQEVDLLKEMRLREVNARKESEEEIERLKEAMAKLETGGRTRGTNLRAKLDDVAGPSTCKDKGRSVMAGSASRRDVFIREARKQLRNLRKEEIVSICEKEGIEYMKLDPTKKAIAQGRADRAFEVEVEKESGKGKGKVDAVVDVPDDEGGNSDKSDEHDSTTS